MTGRLGTGQSLILGLIVVVSGLVALSWATNAETWRERRARISQGATPVVQPQAQSRPQVRPVREQEGSCGFPWSYSRGVKRCVCTREGYSLQSGKCVREVTPISCGDNEQWSAKRAACICIQGMKREGGRCVAEEPVTALEDRATVPPPPPAAVPTPDQVEAIARAQACLAELGYYKGAIDGKRGKQTWAAYWHFKHDHDLEAYSNLLDPPVQEKLAALCKQPEETAALPSDQSEIVIDLGSPQDEPGESAVLVAPEAGEEAVAPEPRGRLDLDCLPEDLVAVLRRAHGLGVAVTSCERACVPAPKGLAQSQLDGLQVKSGVVWCRACVPIEGHLALDDVRRIERAGNVQLCTTPPRQLQRYGEGIADGLRSYMRVRALYRALPPAPEDPEAVAVIIGNRSYDKLPRSVTSYNDADALYAFLTEHLGYRPDNIIDVRDAKKADLERMFGPEPGHDGQLARLVQSQPNAKVLIYYSGHGATDGAQNETFLLPVETEPYRAETAGYKLSTLYANLARLDARSVLVLLETDYGEDHGPSVLPPNLPDMVTSALPKAPVPGLNVIAAADRGQRTLVDVTYDIGLFTRYLIEGLAGGADLAPIGNGDGELNSAEIYAFTAAFVDLAARKTFGVLQRPVFSGAATSVLTSARTTPEGSD